MGIRLERTAPAPVAAPQLDPDQQAVVDHRGGPLLVLAGPGTGKTTTLIEVVVDRLSGGMDPSRILILTFGRRAAAEIRQRLTLRLAGGDAIVPRAWTFHGWCFALINELSPERLRLITGPEQDSQVRELIAGSMEPGPAQLSWPAELQLAARTQAFSSQLRDLINRAQERAVDPALLDQLGRREGRVDWEVAARIYQEYLDGLALRANLDYSSLIGQTIEAIDERAGTFDAINQRYDLVIVDEYQDTDPSQVRLLQAIAGGGSDLIAIGDPDQAIYGFRGSDVRGILEFPESFPHADGRTPARVISLGTSGRCGTALLAASRRVIAPLQYAGTGFGADARGRHRELAVRAGTEDGELAVTTHRSALAEARWIAQQLQSEHVERSTPWQDMAVVVRTSMAMGAIARTLISFGIPVEVAGDELAVGQHPAVRILLSALRCVAAPAERDEEIEALLSSPLVAADPAILRRLARFLRNRAREQDPQTPAPSSARLIAAVVRDPSLLTGVTDVLQAPVLELVRLLEGARAALVGPTGVLEALWFLWDESRWSGDLLHQALRGGHDGVAADASLDAVVALFSSADELVAQRRLGDPLEFIARVEQLQIPGDSRAERGGVRGNSVRILTAHRSKGLEWPVVAVAAVQEGAWPDLRLRGSVLEADRLTPDGVAERADRKQRLDEERRLFYVAITRAKRRLLVSAVDSGTNGELPSVFLDDLGVEVVPVSQQQAPRPTRLVDLVASLRLDLIGADEERAASAAQTLAWLAEQRDEAGRPLCPSADPSTWWGSAEPSASDQPVRQPDVPVAMSGSSLSNLLGCPQKWAFEHEARASSAGGTPQMFGSVIHAIAEEITAGRVEATLEAATDLLDQVWGALPYAAQWESAREREGAIMALRRFLSWHLDDRGRTVQGTEVRFETVVPVAGDAVQVRGSMDRVELDAEGRVVVSDLKTSKNPPTKDEVTEHPQLGVYQAVVRAGGLDVGNVPGGAELIHLRVKEPRGREDYPSIQRQEPLGEVGLIDEQLGTAVRAIREEQFAPMPSEDCRFCAYVASCPAHVLGQRVVP